MTHTSDSDTPYLVSVMVTRAELDTLSDAVADWEDGARDDGDTSLVAGADRVAGLLSRIERSWLAERDQHTLAPAATPLRAPGAWLGDSYTLAVTLTDAQRISVLYALSVEAMRGRDNGDRRYADNLDAVAAAIGRARDAQSDSETLDRATLTDAELGV